MTFTVSTSNGKPLIVRASALQAVKYLQDQGNPEPRKVIGGMKAGDRIFYGGIQIVAVAPDG